MRKCCRKVRVDTASSSVEGVGTGPVALSPL